MANVYQCLLLNIEKVQKSHIRELNPSFLFDLHQGMVTNEYRYVKKMTLSVNMGDLWGDFTTIFWITKYLQTLIYIWNKAPKHVMSRRDMDFQSIPFNLFSVQFSTF